MTSHLTLVLSIGLYWTFYSYIHIPYRPVGAGADPCLYSLGSQPGGRLPLLSVRPAVTFPAAQHLCFSPVPNYTSWCQRHLCMNNLPRVEWAASLLFAQAKPLAFTNRILVFIQVSRTHQPCGFCYLCRFAFNEWMSNGRNRTVSDTVSGKKLYYTSTSNQYRNCWQWLSTIVHTTNFKTGGPRRGRGQSGGPRRGRGNPAVPRWEYQ